MNRDSGRPRRTRRKPPKREITCGMALPAAASRTAVVLAQLAVIRWQIGIALASRDSSGSSR